MAQAKTLHVPISGGMRQDLSEHAAPPGTIIDASNVRFSAVGEVESRPGTRALAIASDAAIAYSGSPDFVAAENGAFLFGTGGLGFRYDLDSDHVQVSGSYSIAEPLGRFTTIAEEQLVTTTAAPQPLSQAVSPLGYVAICYSAAELGSFICKIFTESGTLAAVIEPEVSTTRRAFVVSSGNNFVLVTNSATTVFAKVITIGSDGPDSLGALTSVGTLNSANSYWAACEWPGIGWALVHQSGATTVTVQALSLTVPTDSATFSNTGDAPLSVFCNATHLYAGSVDINSGGDCVSNGIVYDTALNTTSGGVVEIWREAGTAALVLCAPQFGSSSVSGAIWAVGKKSTLTGIDTASYTRLGHLTPSGTRTTTAAGVYVDSCYPHSAPFNNGMIWLRYVPAGGAMVRDVLIDLTIARLGTISADSLESAKVALTGEQFGAVGGQLSFWNHCQAKQLSSGEWLSGVPRLVRSDGTATTTINLEIAEWLLFTLGEPKATAFTTGVTLVSGQLTAARHPFGTQAPDGAVTAANQALGEDVGMFVTPSMSATSLNGTGGLVGGAVYQYRPVVERIDSTGRRHRSAPGPVFALTLGPSDDTVQVSAGFTDCIHRIMSPSQPTPDSVFVLHVYRTEANGSTFYRASPPQGASQFVAGVVALYTDGLSDGFLREREVLYTDGGVLQNDAPPSNRFIRATEDRVWLGGLWDVEQLQSSKILVPGEPPQFSDLPSFRVVLPDACTGIAVQDGTVIAFTRRAVYAIQGQGPNDQGQGEWGSPRQVSGSTGCISHLSILETSIGVFFQSEEGIELLPRGLGEPQFIGMPVQDLMFSSTLGGVANVVSASVVTTYRGRTARFVLDDGTEGGNVILVFDLDTQAWSRDDYNATIDAIADTSDGAVLARHSLASGYGFLLEQMAEDRDSVGSSPVEIASNLEWAELRPFGVAGFGRFGSAIGLFDARPAPSSGYRAGNATITLSVDSRSESGKAFLMTSLTETQAYQRHVPVTETGTCGKLTLATTVGGWRFVGWTVEVDDLGGGRRMAETEQG